MKRLVTLVIVAFIFSSLVTVLDTKKTSAVSGACYFTSTAGPVKGTSGCAVDGLGSYGTNDIFPGRTSASSPWRIPSSVNTKGEFINFIVNKFNNGNTHEKVGAAFIMQEMRGDRTWPSAADRDNWVYLMQLSNVTFESTTMSPNTSSWFDPDKNNTFYAAYSPGTRNVVRIKQNGSLIANIERECGNMVASAITIQPPRWSISGQTTLSGHEGGSNNSNRWVTPGKTLTWNHRAYNNGPDHTDEPVTFKIQIRNQAGNWDGLPVGSAVNTWTRSWGAGSWTDTWQRQYTPGQNENGYYVCQRLVYQDYAWNADGQESNSAADCATVYNKWRIGVSTTRSLADADGSGGPTVGDTITWTHTWDNTGEDQVSQGIGWAIGGQTPNLGATGMNGTYGTATNWPASGANATRVQTRQYRIMAADGGRTICQNGTASPANHMTPLNAASGTAASANACYTVPYDYSLTPTVTSPSKTAEPGQVVHITPNVHNGGTTNSAPAVWEVRKYIFPNQPTSLAGGMGTGDACAFFAGRGYTAPCAAPIQSGTNSFPPLNTITPPGGIDETVANLPAGTRVCYSLSVKPWDDDMPADQWRHSDLFCIVIAKRPKVHIMGSDLRVGGVGAGQIEAGVSTVTTGGSPRTFGSWVEYGAFSRLPNQVIGSGAGLRGGHANATPSDWSKLTFTNHTSTFGNYSPINLSTARNYFNGLATTTTIGAGSHNISSWASGVYDAGANDISLQGSLPADRDIIIRTTGQVRIVGNITIPNSYNSIEAISQVVISAGDIDISNLATTVDAWLLASGYVNTCSEKALTDPLTANDCQSALVVNGPVITPKLHLRRTAGADYNAPQNPAEVFNLRASSYLWAYNYANRSERSQTTYVKELAPRF
jgi:hypothetical protein